MTAKEILSVAREWVGRNEYDGSYKAIIDIYNSQKPLPVGYPLKYTDQWCAGFVTALFVQKKATHLFPCECSVPRMITLAQKMGIWVEDDARIPNPGDIIVYDWGDNGVGDNHGGGDHVGIVEKVDGKITIIEGNYKNAVTRRTIRVNGLYIRGWICPKYAPEAKPKPVAPSGSGIELPMLRFGDQGNTVKAMQAILNARGCSCGAYGVDGYFGRRTFVAVREFQADNGLTVDGICGNNTWKKLLGV